MNTTQAMTVCRHIEKANYGSFTSALACTYMLADQDNREKLLQAFSDVFERIERDMLAYHQFMANA